MQATPALRLRCLDADVRGQPFSWASLVSRETTALLMEGGRLVVNGSWGACGTWKMMAEKQCSLGLHFYILLDRFRNSHCSYNGPKRESDLDFLPSVVRHCELAQ